MPPAAGRSVYLLHPREVVGDASPHAAGSFDQIANGFALQSSTTHTRASDRTNADLILAPIQGPAYGLCFETLRRSPVYREHAGKLIVYSTEDNQFPAIQGLYPAISPRWVRRGWALPAHYISAHFHKFAFATAELDDKNLLFSFVGSSRTHWIRQRIVQWRHSDSVVIDASNGVDKYWWQEPDKDQFLESFREVTRRSKFVICPRGFSSSSIRLFEAMEAGAVPVIIADELALPGGPDWDSFSLRVRERDVEDVPMIVEKCQDRAAEMGATARRTWEAYFSPQATVAALVGWAEQLLARRHRRPAFLRLAEYTSPRFVKNKVLDALDPCRFTAKSKRNET